MLNHSQQRARPILVLPSLVILAALVTPFMLGGLFKLLSFIPASEFTTPWDSVVASMVLTLVLTLCILALGLYCMTPFALLLLIPELAFWIAYQIPLTRLPLKYNDGRMQGARGEAESR